MAALVDYQGRLLNHVEMLHQPGERPFVERNENPRPDKPPEDSYRPDDRDVLIE